MQFKSMVGKKNCNFKYIYTFKCDYFVVKWCVSMNIMLSTFCFENSQCHSGMKIIKKVSVSVIQV